MVDFSDASKLYEKYRAFYGWPRIFVEGGIKLSNISLLESKSSNAIGLILEIKEESVVVACAEGSLEIGTIQVPSKKAVTAKAYCLGKGLKVGNSLF